MSLSAIESLESRRLFSGIAIQGHTLRIVGAAGSSNLITYGLSSDGQGVDATLSFPTKAGLQSVTRTFPLSKGLHLVSVSGGNKGDSITCDESRGVFLVNAVINGNGGDDTIISGSGDDKIYGGAGADSINGGAGSDRIFGDPGKDTLLGGDGDDYLKGGQDRDSLEGNAGDDTLINAFGDDTMVGGTGSDLFIRSVTARKASDFVQGVDRIKIVTPSTNNSSSLLNTIFPITSLF